MKTLFALALSGLLSISLPLFALDYDSSYSSISEADCRLVEFIEEGESSTSSCPSFNGIKVQLLEGDLRQALNLVRKGKEYSIGQWSGGFSELGSLIEWRHKKDKPEEIMGLIVRLNISDIEDSKKKTSYLLVAKVMTDKICVVGQIPPKAGINQNQQARNLLDSSALRLCLDDPRMVLDSLVFLSKASWRISFKGKNFSWQHSDRVETGTFSMTENGEIKAQLSSKTITANYDGLEMINWDGIGYRLETKNSDKK